MLEKQLKELNQAFPTCIDVETTGLKHYNSKIFAFSIVQLKPKHIKIWVHTDNTPKELWYMPLKMFLANSRYKKLWFNGKFDWLMLMNEGITVVNNHEDVMIKAHLCNENLPSLKLKKLCDKFFPGDTNIIKLLELEKRVKEDLAAKKTDNYAMCDHKLMEEYGVGDGELTLKLDEYLDHNYWCDDLQKVFNIENQLLEVLTKMEYDGIDVDIPYLNKMNQGFLEKRSNTLNKIMHIDAFPTVDIEEVATIINSSKKLGILVYDNWGLRNEQGKINYTKGGNYCTDADAIRSVIAANKGTKYAEVLRIAKEYVSIEHMLDTYINPYLENALKFGKVYPWYNQTVTVTGRLSCWNPNMQNLPKKEEKYGDEIRHIIHNPQYKDGVEFLDNDYSQIELRLEAHYCRSDKMIKAFLDGKDLHQETADELDLSRRDAKDINFMIIYGGGARALAAKLGIPYEIARQYLNNYFAKRPEVKMFAQQVQQAINSKGYVKTFYGRRRRLEPKKAYIGTNAIIQGTAAEVLKLAMIRIYREFNQDLVKIKAPIHDELLMLKPIGEYDKQIKELMEDHDTFRVPLPIDSDTFKEHWGLAG